MRVILNKYVAKMASRWDSIGIQLRQANLVRLLRSPSSELGNWKVQQIIDAWLLSPHKDVPVSVKTISEVLKSDAVKLGAVATQIEKVRGTVHALNVFRQTVL